MAETVAVLPKDTRLGQYRISRMLGEGGMGFVYEATHQSLNRRTAIKMLRPELAEHEQVVSRFLNEARAANIINHQNIVSVYDFSTGADGSVYFVMEYLEGETLDDLMRKRRPMQVPLLLHVFGQIAKALAAAHAKQIVHRDLKPVNVFVVPREDNPYFIKLLDFGIAQLRGAGATQGLTLAGTVLGTPQYMSPEQISGEPIDARTDVWAFGVMLYRAATGQAPFKGEEFAELADRILHHAPVPAQELVAMPASLAALIASCLQRDPAARCPSIADAIAGLEHVKRSCGLDDDAVLRAVRADAGALVEPVPPMLDPTRPEVGGSLPRHQGVPDAPRAPQARVVSPKPRSRAGWIAAAVVAVLGLGAAAYALVLRGGDGPATPPAPVGPATIKSLVASGATEQARALAEADLRAAITDDKLQQPGLVIDAIQRAHAVAAVPLLYAALERGLELKVKAARALGALGLPQAAPKIAAALAALDKNRIPLAIELFRLRDKSARNVVVAALEDPKHRHEAAVALAEAGDDGGKAVLSDELGGAPVGSVRWRAAAAGLAKLGFAEARKLLEDELAATETERAVGAAERLAQLGSASARAMLTQLRSDPDPLRVRAASLALARLGDPSAASWVPTGLASADAEDRLAALAIAGRLLEPARPHLAKVAALATDDPDERVRWTAEAVLLGL